MGQGRIMLPEKEADREQTASDTPRADPCDCRLPRQGRTACRRGGRLTDSLESCQHDNTLQQADRSSAKRPNRAVGDQVSLIPRGGGKQHAFRRVDRLRCARHG